MSQKDFNEHAEIIANHVFHSFPYKQFIPNFKGPHAEDCEGCVVNAEVNKLISKLDTLAPVEKIIDELEKVKEERSILTLDRYNAFHKAGVADDGPVADLVTTLVNERNKLIRLIKEIDSDLEAIRNKIGR